MSSLPAHEAIRNRKATRNFSSRKVRDQLIYELLELSNRAPSGFNLQPWHYVLVQDQELRGLLHHVALGQRQIIEAPMTVVFVANPRSWKTNFPRVIKESLAAGTMTPEYADICRNAVRATFRTDPFGLYGFMKRIAVPLQRLKKPTPRAFYVSDEIRHYVREQTMLSAATFMIAATGTGLASSPLEGFDEERLKKLLAIPRYMTVPIIIPIGYPMDDDHGSDSIRLPLLEKLSVDLFPNTLSKLKSKNPGFAGQEIE